jgi:hypothetical protein
LTGEFDACHLLLLRLVSSISANPRHNGSRNSTMAEQMMQLKTNTITM